MMPFRNTEAIIHSPYIDIDIFDIVAGVLQRHTFAPYMFIIYLDQGFRMSIDQIKENGFILKKNVRISIYLSATMTDADNADDQVLLTNS